MERIGKVESAALDQNGWHAIAVSKERYRSGLRPNGVIAFVNGEALTQERGGRDIGNCGTAQWCEREDGLIFFFSGHYDLLRDTAMDDFIERVRRESGGRSGINDD